jgi:hypothetical protein
MILEVGMHLRNIDPGRRFSAIAMTAIGAFGCSGTDSSTSGEYEPVASRIEGFATAPCAAAADDATLFGEQGSIVSPQTYNNCGKSFVVDVIDSTADQFRVAWADNIPVTQTTCLDTELHAKYYERNASGGWTWVRELTGRTGVWLLGWCFPPSLSLPATSSEFRIAATARRVSGGNPTRKLRISVE